ncbi:MAG TPA: hypothetical protein VMW38_06125 [Terriglobia bacterium]|nr:hypothetical protein [Terriglobia bacterium]
MRAQTQEIPFATKIPKKLYDSLVEQARNTGVMLKFLVARYISEGIELDRKNGKGS